MGHEKSSSVHSTKGQKQEPNPNRTVSTILRNNPDTTSNPNVASGYFMLNLDGTLHGNFAKIWHVSNYSQSWT